MIKETLKALSQMLNIPVLESLEQLLLAVAKGNSLQLALVEAD
jgi:hypothetical protein